MLILWASRLKPLSLAAPNLCDLQFVAAMQVTWLPFLLVIFMVRGGFANSTFPIDRSILMDYTPSTQRGFESVFRCQSR